jgi:DNA modification methylase
MTTPTEMRPLHHEMLGRIQAAEEELTRQFSGKIQVNHDLDRTLVSFQANKLEVGHRWCKYREGFSAELIRYLIERSDIRSGRLLDPFAGSGTTLFVAAELGLDAVGIELLPCSAEIIQVRSAVLRADQKALAAGIHDVLNARAWLGPGHEVDFPHLKITAGAFPRENERQLRRLLFEAGQTNDKLLSRVLRFAALSVLEEISFTRKDGQYLRWDQRSGRCLGKKDFDKGKIESFDDAIRRKLGQIAGDLLGREAQPMLFPRNPVTQEVGNIDVRVGSCLDILPQMEAESFSGIITSPPYCNRYDYTRTYALELAMLGVGEEGIRRLRQAMLSCTVENRDKHDLAEKFGPDTFRIASRAYESQRLLALLLEYLEECRLDGSINNPGIVRMVRNYFFELALLVAASARVLKPGAPFVMVNDNVRYQGAHVPVDLILSEIAQQVGFEVETIWVLPKGKGNSSQQMGRHGRQEIRKCVYTWRKGS